MNRQHAYEAGALSFSQIRDRLVLMGVPVRAAEATAEAEISSRNPKIGVPGVSRAARAAKIATHAAVQRPFFLSRAGDKLDATVYGPPRTSKNSRRGLYRHSIAYASYRATLVAAIAPESDHVGLPLPIGRYNLAAVFFVDRRGDRADLFGLLQGLADALQAAGVVTDDWQFRTVDGSRVVTGDECPRVALTISPIEG